MPDLILEEGKAFTLTPGKDFKSDEGIYIIAMDGNNKKLEVKQLNFRITDPAGSNDGLSLFRGISFMVPEEQPVVGGQEFKIDLKGIKCSVSYENNKYKMLIGMDQDTIDTLLGGSQYDLCKNSIKEVKRSIETGHPVKLEDMLKKTGVNIDYNRSKKNKFVIKNGIELDGAVLGYAEGKYENGQILFVEGGMILDASFEYIYRGQMICYSVPVYYTIGVGGEVNHDIILKDIRKLPDGSLEPVWEGTLSLNAPIFEIGAGIGVQYLAQVGIGGKAELDLEIPYGINRNPEAYLTGEAFFEIKFFGFSMVTKLLGGKIPYNTLFLKVR